MPNDILEPLEPPYALEPPEVLEPPVLLEPPDILQSSDVLAQLTMLERLLNDLELPNFSEVIDALKCPLDDPNQLDALELPNVF